MQFSLKAVQKTVIAIFAFSMFFITLAPFFEPSASRQANAMFGPSRQKATISIEINATPEKVWAVIGNFDDMSWHPAVEKTQGKGGNVINATRVLTLKGGGTIDELLVEYSAEKMSYFYRITNVDVKVLPVTNYSAYITVKQAKNGKSIVTWDGGFLRGHPFDNPPDELNDQAAVETMSSVYEAGLSALKKKLESGS